LKVRYDEGGRNGGRDGNRDVVLPLNPHRRKRWRMP
jgi:hypothetical protein